MELFKTDVDDFRIAVERGKNGCEEGRKKFFSVIAERYRGPGAGGGAGGDAEGGGVGMGREGVGVDDKQEVDTPYGRCAVSCTRRGNDSPRTGRRKKKQDFIFI